MNCERTRWSHCKKSHSTLEELGLDVVTISMAHQVEQRLLSAGYTQIAEHYIEYRLQRDIERYGYADHNAARPALEHLR